MTEKHSSSYRPGLEQCPHKNIQCTNPKTNSPEGCEAVHNCDLTCTVDSGGSDRPFCRGSTDMLMSGFASLLYDGLSDSAETNNCVMLFHERFVLDEPWKFFLGLLFTVVFGIFTEFWVSQRRKLSVDLRRRRGKMIKAAMYAFNMVVGYLIMLIAMTYSLELFLAVIVGLGIGHVTFNTDAPVGDSVTACCAGRNGQTVRDYPSGTGIGGVRRRFVIGDGGEDGSINMSPSARASLLHEDADRDAIAKGGRGGHQRVSQQSSGDGGTSSSVQTNPVKHPPNYGTTTTEGLGSSAPAGPAETVSVGGADLSTSVLAGEVESLQKLEVNIGGMVCGACELTIGNAVRAVDCCVEDSVLVSYALNRCEVTVRVAGGRGSSGRAEKQKIVDAIEDVGFEVLGVAA